ncbi:hypothetical protein [Paraburkholderia sediminicola]|uniref:hypothetical protein n=1 Tax=Paraburkholderia sediminicola TaxID=458836 RepID=UPI0038B74622
MHNANPAVGNATSVAMIQAYSEWRPTRWRLTTSTGKNYGLFNTHERASRFADGVLMGLEESDYVSIKPIRSTGYDTWLGDSIGLGDTPACISLIDQFGQHYETTVANVLHRASDVDARGLGRIVSALRLMADVGELHADDLAAWRKHEAEYPIRTGGETL